MKKAIVFLFITIIMIVGRGSASGQNHEEKLQAQVVADTLVQDKVADSRNEFTEHKAVHQESSSSGEHKTEHSETVAGKHNTEHSASHGADMSPLFFIIIALIIGAATRHFLRKSPLPFTVTLLIFGLLMGVFVRLGWFGEFEIGSLNISLGFLNDAVSWAGHIDPHLILYIFLPTLIFEAAFAMDFHTFKKTVTNASILAIPGIIIAMILTAALMIAVKQMGLGLESWGWPVALMFGAVASATDPVAVVALLKELGASKKLGTLIEGESMLNDGTAIVLFMVFFTGITGQAADSSPVIEFIRVAVGGIAVGLIIGSLAISWVRRVFNDALVEISVIIAAAYITFYIAEHFLHVSGVLGLVTLGLAMASVGKTRISPEVEHFLHEFWELFAFIANTLIFIIVGVVIAEQANITGKNILILIILYIGVHIIRAIVIAIFYPIMRKSGYGMDLKNATVLWYGALRGAVGLALALIVTAEMAIAPDVRGQFLFFTAGLVILTLLINATSIKYLVNALGLTKISPAKAQVQMNVQKYVYSSMLNALEKARRDRYLSRANWEVVKEYLPDPVEEEAYTAIEEDKMAEFRRRVLEKEKSSYWHQFKDGLLGAQSVMSLSSGMEGIIDKGGSISLSERKDLEDSWKAGRFLEILQKMSFLSKLSRRFFFEKLSVSYDSARAFVEAQDDALKLVESMFRGLEAESDKSNKEGYRLLNKIEEEITENKIHGQTFLRNLRKNYPEIYSAIATRQAIRILLNYERYTIERLYKNGRLEKGESQKMILDIEKKMKKLLDSPPIVNLPDTVNLLKESKLFRELDASAFEKIIPLLQTRVFSPGEKIIRESSSSDGLYFLARGSVRISIKNKVVDILNRGQFIGEIADMTGLSRSAEVVVESPVTSLFISSVHMKKIIEDYPEIKRQMWNLIGVRISENLLRETSPYSQWKYEQLKKLVNKGNLVPAEDVKMTVYKDKIRVLISGEATNTVNNKVDNAPLLLEDIKYKFTKEALLWVC